MGAHSVLAKGSRSCAGHLSERLLAITSAGPDLLTASVRTGDRQAQASTAKRMLSDELRPPASDSLSAAHYFRQSPGHVGHPCTCPLRRISTRDFFGENVGLPTDQQTTTLPPTVCRCCHATTDQYVLSPGRDSFPDCSHPSEGAQKQAITGDRRCRERTFTQG